VPFRPKPALRQEGQVDLVAAYCCHCAVVLQLSSPLPADLAPTSGRRQREHVRRLMVRRFTALVGVAISPSPFAPQDPSTNEEPWDELS
jgi:hypothetical protein